MKKNWLAIVLMMIIVPLAGELKFYPFAGDFSTFRVSFGSPAFLFFLLWLRQTTLLLGILAGLAVLIFRMILDYHISGAAWPDSFMLHYPAVFYYIAYAFVFYVSKAKNIYNPWGITLLSITAEITSSMVELVLSPTHYSHLEILSFPILSKILIIAVIRSFFVLSFFFIIRLRQAEFMAEEQKEQNKHMLLLISSLYEELIQLTKSQQNAENVTRNCYHLYQDLQNAPDNYDHSKLTQNILSIAGQVHEIKKDNHRIYVSLTRLIADGKLNDYMPAEELGEIIVQSHQRYARALNRSIHFALTVEPQLPQLHVYTVLSLVNNLVSNAVESIQDTGSIGIAFYRTGPCIAFRVSDNGPGIPANKRALIFKPGYTTKFDVSGNPSTGMGLCYIKDLAASLEGHLTLLEADNSQETIFVIQLPLKSLAKEG